MTDQRPEPLSDPGVPTLLRRLSDFAGESVYLWYTPPPAADAIRWRVWTGVPTGSGGGEWGAGVTPYGALQAAFEHVVRSTFDGRIGTTESSTVEHDRLDVVRDMLRSVPDDATPQVMQASIRAALRLLFGATAEVEPA